MCPRPDPGLTVGLINHEPQITMTLGLRDEGIRTLGLNWLFVSIANQVSNFYNMKYYLPIKCPSVSLRFIITSSSVISLLFNCRCNVGLQSSNKVNISRFSNIWFSLIKGNCVQQASFKSLVTVIQQLNPLYHTFSPTAPKYWPQEHLVPK